MNIIEKLNQFLNELGIDYDIIAQDGNIKIEIVKPKDRKAKFEDFVNRVSDEIFMETFESMDKELVKKYNDNSEEVIDEFLQILIEKLQNRISKLEDLADEAMVLLENS